MNMQLAPNENIKPGDCKELHMWGDIIPLPLEIWGLEVG